MGFGALKKKAEEKIEKTKPVQISISLIDDPQFHDRTYISDKEIEELSENINRFGLIEPIVVRRKDGGRYERIAGFRRLEAVKRLGWSKIPAVILDVDEKTALAIMLSENLHRENLSDFDKVYSILQYLEFALNLTEDGIKKFINRWKNKLSDRVKEEITDEEIELKEEIESILKDFKIPSIAVFDKMLNMLTVHPLIKEAVQKYGWKYTIALEVNKLRHDEKLMKQLIDEIIEKDMGFAEVKKKVDELRGDKVEKFPYGSLYRKVQKKWKQLPPEKKEEIDRLLKSVEEILESVK